MTHEGLVNPRHPEGLTVSEEILAQKLYQIGVIKFGGFKLKLHQQHPDAATTLATAFSLQTETPQVVLRRQEKIGHGIEGKFVTPYTKGQTVLLIDDLITRADSKLEAIATLEEAGLRVTDVVVLLDREQGGRQQLEAKGIRLHAAYTLNPLLDFYTRIGVLNKDTVIDTRNRLDQLNAYLTKA